MAIKGTWYFFFLLMWVGTVMAASPPLYLPDGSLRPAVRITIPAGEEREFLFQPQGVRFLAGKARIRDVAGPVVDPSGRERKEIVIDADDRARGIPWMHDEKPFRLRIHAVTDFTFEARQSWEGDPEKDLPRTTLSEGKRCKTARGNHVVRDQSHGSKSVVRGLPKPYSL